MVGGSVVLRVGVGEEGVLLPPADMWASTMAARASSRVSVRAIIAACEVT